MIRRLLAVIAVFWVLLAGAASLAQEQESPPPNQEVADTAAPPPTTEPSAPQDPLRSPATMVQEFLLAIGEVEKKPERMTDAVRCLDLSALQQADPAAAEKQAPLLAKQLEQIIDALLNVHGKSLEEIPAEPDDVVVVFPADGDIRLALARSNDGCWRFSAATVAAIPQWSEAVSEAKEKEEEQTPRDEVAEGVPPGFRSPRATMRTFMEAMSEGRSAAAAECLELSELPAASRAEIGSVLAVQLLFVMERIEVVVYQKIPDQPDDQAYTWYLDEHGSIKLARQQEGEWKGRWLFTAATVKSIEPLFKAFEDRPRVEGLESVSFRTSPRRWLLERIPSAWKGEVFSVQLWQWGGMVVLLVLGWVANRVAFFIFCAVARPLGRSKHIELPETCIASSMRPLGMLVMVLIWWIGLWLLLIPAAVQSYVWPALKFVVTVVAVWAFYRIIDLFGDYFAARAKRSPSRLDDVLVPLVRKTAKIVLVVVGVIYILSALGVSDQTVGRMFAGLGLGGLAFALAAQDSLKNFFGSVTVVLDRPFQVGDWVKVGSAAEGTVESVGLRSSRIRTFYNSEITVPNSEVMNAIVDNMGRRQYRRISCQISVTYSTTPEQLEAFCEGIRELIRRHPYTRKDYYLAWVNEFAASSINILLYCFHETPDWVTELRERHRLFLDIMRLAKRLGVEFAFPTQTIHLAKEAADGGERAASPPASPLMDGRTPSEEALALGRDEAMKLAQRTLEDTGEHPPPFEFPKV